MLIHFVLNKIILIFFLCLQGHEDAVEDVAWHIKDENMFGSVGDDHKLMIWDLRSTSVTPQQSIIAHEAEVKYSVLWSVIMNRSIPFV